MITDFIRSTSLDELLEHRMRLGTESLFIAGGTEINRLGSESAPLPYTGLSLEGLGLDVIAENEDGIFIGAMVRLQDLVEADEVSGYLKEAACFAGSRTLRNMATIGGNIAACRDDSYLLPVLIAAKARIHTIDIDSDGRIIREDIPIREFVENFENFKGSCIEEIFIKKKPRIVRVKRYARTAQRRPDAVVAFGAELIDGQYADVRVVVGGVGAGIQRLPVIEQAIENRDLTEEAQCLQMVRREITPADDITGSREYRQYLIAVTILKMIETERGGQS